MKKKVDSREKFTWYEDERFECANPPFVFLSRSPLTLGHSQVVVPSIGACTEEEMFEHAAVICKKAMCILRKVLSEVVEDASCYFLLKNFTKTYGDYIKTLVLRASANEIDDEYRIHLVPYYQSHAEQCRLHFQNIHQVGPEEVGGLLGWLGHRESIVDHGELNANNSCFLNVNSGCQSELIELTDLLRVRLSDE